MKKSHNSLLVVGFDFSFFSSKRKVITFNKQHFKSKFLKNKRQGASPLRSRGFLGFLEYTFNLRFKFVSFVMKIFEL